jgi:hypothetical protein
MGGREDRIDVGEVRFEKPHDVGKTDHLGLALRVLKTEILGQV